MYSALFLDFLAWFGSWPALWSLAFGLVLLLIVSSAAIGWLRGR